MLQLTRIPIRDWNIKTFPETIFFRIVTINKNPY